MKRSTAQSIDAYIAEFPAEIQIQLRAMRDLIREAAPIAQEKISYAIPTFFLEGNLVHFAAFQKHIGFYPGGCGVEAFRAELGPYKIGRGSVQFPLGQPFPADLIRRIVHYRVAQNTQERGARRSQVLPVDGSGGGV